MKRFTDIKAETQFAAYVLYILEAMDSNDIDYWCAYENCFNEEIIDEARQKFSDTMLVDALLLLSEYDTCRAYLPKDKVEKSKEDIINKLKQIIKKDLDESV